jgi:hypothetical protein
VVGSHIGEMRLFPCSNSAYSFLMLITLAASISYNLSKSKANNIACYWLYGSLHFIHIVVTSSLTIYGPLSSPQSFLVLVHNLAVNLQPQPNTLGVFGSPPPKL